MCLYIRKSLNGRRVKGTGKEMTERNMPQNGELYRHFKNKLYQVITTARHSETGEILVIYQALYGNYGTYARPLEMFMSEVEHEKYPDARQKYRFEKIGQEEVMEMELSAAQPVKTLTPGLILEEADALRENDPVSQTEITKSRQEPEVDPKLMDFFDADTLDEKYNILVSMRSRITNQMINNMAVVLDVVIPEGELDDRYEELKTCMKTKQRYESVHRMR